GKKVRGAERREALPSSSPPFGGCVPLRSGTLASRRSTCGFCPVSGPRCVRLGFLRQQRFRALGRGGRNAPGRTPFPPRARLQASPAGAASCSVFGLSPEDAPGDEQDRGNMDKILDCVKD